MSATRVTIDPDDPGSLPEGRVDHAVLDGATEADLVSQKRDDDAEAMRTSRGLPASRCRTPGPKGPWPSQRI